MNPNEISSAFEGDGTPLIRTDFSNDAAWSVVVRRVTNPDDTEDSDRLVPNVSVVDDPVFAGATGATLAEALSDNDGIGGYALLADARSMAEATAGGEITLDYVDFSVSDPEDAELFDSFMGRTFRCAVAEFVSVDENLSLANMDFVEFADNTDPDGVFRGFGD